MQQSEQLRELSNRLLQAQDDERRHIARELQECLTNIHRHSGSKREGSAIP